MKKIVYFLNKMNFVIVSLYLLEIFLPFCSAGTIKTSGTFPIANSIANCNQFSDYTFNFIVETAIPAGGLLVITFPPQYNLGLGIPLPSTSSCSVSCSISQTTRSVTLTYPNKVYNGSGQPFFIFF